MTQPELKSCPFCGADVCEICFDDEDTAPDGGRRARVECSESETCFANTGWQDDLDDAIAAWNTRALTPKQQAAEEMFEGLTLIEHKADQMLQGQYTAEQLGGVILAVSRATLAKAGQQ